MDADYQRDFVWGDDNQRELVKSIVEEYPIGDVSVIYRNREPYCEVVDGKQRLTTVIGFFQDKVPYVDEDGKEIYYSEMDEVEQRRLKQYTIPVSGLDVQREDQEPTRLQLLTFFYRKNFRGVPQTEEMRLKLEKEILELGGKV